MSTRAEVLERLYALVDDNAHMTTYFRGTRHVKSHLDSFGDETLLLLDAAVRDEVTGKEVTARTILLLTTLQQRNLEPVVRNIVIFAEARHRYAEDMSIFSKTWKVYHPVEKYIRTRVCGAHNALETAAQRKVMISLFHGIFALLDHSLLAYSSRVLDSYVVQILMREDIQKPEYQTVLDSFQRHPESADRMYPVIAERGPVHAGLLEAVVFFGDDEVPKSIMSGTL